MRNPMELGQLTWTHSEENSLSPITGQSNNWVIFSCFEQELLPKINKADL